MTEGYYVSKDSEQFDVVIQYDIWGNVLDFKRFNSKEDAEQAYGPITVIDNPNK